MTVAGTTTIENVNISNTTIVTSELIMAPAVNTQVINAGTSNTLSIITNGNTSLFDANGNLGIGVTPSTWTSYKAFQINTGGFLYGYTNEVGIGSSAYYNSGWKYTDSTNKPTWFAGANGSFYWNVAPSGTAGNAITFTQAMTLNSSGYLGIGTTSPVATLTVQTTGSTSGTLLLTDGTNTTRFGTWDGVNNRIEAVNRPLFITSYTGGVSLGYAGVAGLTVDNSNNVGITGAVNVGGLITGMISQQGTSIPNMGTGGDGTWCQLGTWATVQGGYVLNIKMYAMQGYNASIGQDQVTDIYFKTSNGSSNVSGFYGDGYAMNMFSGTTNAPGQIVVVQNNTGSYTFWGYFPSLTGGGSYFTWSSSQGTYFTPNVVAGYSSAPSGTTLTLTTESNTYSSDVRLKDEIETLTGSLDTVLKLRSVSYKWKTEYSGKVFSEDPRNRRTHYGFIADELLNVVPAIVDSGTKIIGGMTDIKTYRYEEMTPLLVNAIQELKTIVDAQAQEIARMKAQ
jgi:hypothetical protein